MYECNDQTNGKNRNKKKKKKEKKKKEGLDNRRTVDRETKMMF